MKNVAMVVLALGMLACSNNSRPVLVDSGIATGDTGMVGHDSGMTTGHDTGMTTGSCTLTYSNTMFGSLSAGCLPRCSAATATTINGCPTTDMGACLQAALDADTTPSIPWSQNGMAATMNLNCATCFGAQQLHCYSAGGCASEVTAYLMCDPMAADCSAQNTALNNCGTTNQTAIQACFGDATMGVQACFG